MSARSVRNNISFKRMAVQEHLADALADTIRILYRDLVLGSAETAGHGVLLPLRTYTWIYLETIVCRLDAEDVLGDSIPVPCCCTCEPAVLCLTRLCGVLSGDHLRVNIRLDLMQSAVSFGI